MSGIRTNTFCGDRVSCKSNYHTITMAPVLFNISTEYKSQTLVCGISALVCGISALVCGISALVCGISALVCGISALACGISARNDSTVSLVYHPSLLLLLPTC